MAGFRQHAERREVALKVTRLPRGELPRDELARFAEEAQITAQLEHPNVVPVHDLGTAPDGHAYFSMKLIPGRSLESILEQRRNNDPATLAQFGLRRLLDVFLRVVRPSTMPTRAASSIVISSPPTSWSAISAKCR